MGLLHLPVELLYGIAKCSVLSSRDLKNLRLAHPLLGNVIAQELFQRVDIKISHLFPSLLLPEEAVSERQNYPEHDSTTNDDISRKISRKRPRKRPKHDKKYTSPRASLPPHVYNSLRPIRDIPSTLAVDFCVKAGKGEGKIPSPGTFQSLCRYLTALKNVKARIHPSGSMETSLVIDMLCGNNRSAESMIPLEVTVVSAGSGPYGWLSWDRCPALSNLIQIRNLNILRLANDWLPSRNRDYQRLAVTQISQQSPNLKMLEISENWIGSFYALMQKQVREVEFSKLKVLKLVGRPGIDISLYGASKLRALRELDMSESEDPAPEFWTKLSIQGISLEKLWTRFVSEQCFMYIASLERLTCLDIKFNRFKYRSANSDGQQQQQQHNNDDEEDLGALFWCSVIPRIHHTLVNLSVLPRRSIYYSDEFCNRINFEALAGWDMRRCAPIETSGYRFAKLKRLTTFLLQDETGSNSIQQFLVSFVDISPKLENIHAKIIYWGEHIESLEKAPARTTSKDGKEDYCTTKISANFEAWGKPTITWSC